MGLAKAEWIKTQERGWSAPNTYVCPDCVEDSTSRASLEKWPLPTLVAIAANMPRKLSQRRLAW